MVSIPRDARGRIEASPLESILTAMDSARAAGDAASAAAAASATARAEALESTLTAMDAAQTAALAGKAPWIGADTTITVQAGAANANGAYSTVQNAFDLYLDQTVISPQATVTINIVGQVDCGVSILSMRHPNWQRIKLRGAAPLTSNVLGIASVTGSRGNYLVGVNLDSVAGVVVGSWALIDNLSGVSPTQGGQAAPVKGGFGYGICNAATSQTLAYVSLADPTHITFTSSVAAVVTPGVSLVRLQGQTRLVTALSGDGTVATVNTALRQGVGNLVYWQLLVAEDGTCSTTNGNLTIAGMDATTRASPGDVVLIADGSDIAAWVYSVPGAGQINTSRSFSCAAGTKFAIVNMAAYAHSGAFCVESVDAANKRIYVRNTAAAEWTPGIAGVTSGRCRVLTSVLRGSSSGVTMLDGTLDYDALAIVGGAGPTTIGASGIGLSAVGTGRGLEPGVAVVAAGWRTSYYVHDGAACKILYGFVARNSYAGVDMSRADVNLDTCYFHGNVKYDVVGDMGGARVSRILSAGSGMVLRGQTGFEPYGDWPRIWGASDTAILFENDCGGQVVGCVALACGRSGASVTAILDFQNGGKGRATGLAVLGYYGPQAVNCTVGRAEASESVVSLGANGFYAGSVGDLDLQKSAAVCLTGTGYLQGNLGRINALKSAAGQCSGGGYLARHAKMDARYCAPYLNSGFDYSAPDGDGGSIDALGVVGSPIYAQTLNTWLKAGGFIADGAAKLT